MKDYLSLLAKMILCTVLVGASGCDEKEEQIGRFAFNLDVHRSPDSRVNGDGLELATHARITITDSNGAMVRELISIPLIKFGSSVVTEEISLPVGDYYLTQFVITDINNNALFATPIEGSELAHLVSDPLPIHFAISHSAVNHIAVEVVSTGDQLPEDFGYASFEIRVVSPSLSNVDITVFSEFSQVAEVRSWVWNKTTYDRHWISHLATLPHSYFASAQLEPGEYVIETHVTLSNGLVYTRRNDVAVGGDTSLVIEMLATLDPHIRYDRDHVSFLISADPCVYDYQVYADNEVDDIYVSMDRGFYEAGISLLSLYDEFCTIVDACGSSIDVEEFTGYYSGNQATYHWGDPALCEQYTQEPRIGIGSYMFAYFILKSGDEGYVDVYHSFKESTVTGRSGLSFEERKKMISRQP